MLDAGQGLGEEVRDVEAARHMLDAELLSLDAVLQPVEAHVDALREARWDGLVGQTHGYLIVTQEQGRGLWVSEVVIRIQKAWMQVLVATLCTKT